MITRVLETTSTPLPANGEWTSSWYDAEWANHVIASADSDVAGELFLEQSEDMNTVHFKHRVALAANTSFTTIVIRAARYVRIRYKNGATAQTRFLASLGAVDHVH